MNTKNKNTRININDIIGKTFNEITVLSYSHRDDSKGYVRHYYNCKCSCGKEFKCMRGQIVSGKTKSCGHINNIKDISGNKYSRLKVINLAYIKNSRSYYNCICDCGKKCIVARDALINGKTRSCGCYSREIHSRPKTHGMSHTRIFRIWQHIKDRCLNQNNIEYHNYGGRGIFICKEWLDSFENFYNDMGENYNKMSAIYGEENISINRINNNDGYYKENCEWATRQKQQRNQRGNIIVEINGKIYTLIEAYNDFAIPGLSYNIVRSRYVDFGWNIVDALTTPIIASYVPEIKDSNNKYSKDNRAFYFDLNI